MNRRTFITLFGGAAVAWHGGGFGGLGGGGFGGLGVSIWAVIVSGDAAWRNPTRLGIRALAITAACFADIDAHVEVAVEGGRFIFNKKSVGQAAGMNIWHDAGEMISAPSNKVEGRASQALDRIIKRFSMPGRLRSRDNDRMTLLLKRAAISQSSWAELTQVHSVVL